MEVAAVLVDEMILTTAAHEAAIAATLYQFAQPRWVSTHPDREGRKLGPLTLLERDPGGGGQEDVAEVSFRHFPPRALHCERARRPTISYKETWTVPPWAIYALVLPGACVAAHLRLTRQGPGDWQPDIQLGVSHDGRLFHYSILGWTHEPQVLHVEARVELDKARYDQVLTGADVVAGTRHYQELREHVRGGLMSSDFWFRLLELGGKLMG